MKQKPIVRHEAKATLQLVIQTAIEREHNYLYQCCLNCENFVEKTELCSLVNKRPPAKIIVYSCEHWSERDQIPF